MNKDKQKAPDYTCRICGSTKNNRSQFYGGEVMEQKKLCFHCDFWDEKLSMKDEPNVVRVQGHHYLIGPEGSPFPGFCGRTFAIKFFDGRTVKTSNLWHQGEIPERFKEQLPDNAEFVKTET